MQSNTNEYSLEGTRVECKCGCNKFEIVEIDSNKYLKCKECGEVNTTYKCGVTILTHEPIV